MKAASVMESPYVEIDEATPVVKTAAYDPGVTVLDGALPLLGYDLEKRHRAHVEAHDLDVAEYLHPSVTFGINSPRKSVADEPVHRRKPGAVHHIACAQLGVAQQRAGRGQRHDPGARTEVDDPEVADRLGTIEEAADLNDPVRAVGEPAHDGKMPSAQGLLALGLRGLGQTTAIDAGALLAAGVPLVEALESVAGATGNIVYENGVMRIRDEVATGQRLQQAMENPDLFPNIVNQMIAVGEESSSLEERSAKVTDM